MNDEPDKNAMQTPPVEGFTTVGDAASAVIRKIREQRKTDNAQPKPVAAE